METNKRPIFEAESCLMYIIMRENWDCVRKGEDFHQPLSLFLISCRELEEEVNGRQSCLVVIAVFISLQAFPSSSPPFFPQILCGLSPIPFCYCGSFATMGCAGSSRSKGDGSLFLKFYFIWGYNGSFLNCTIAFR